MVHTGLKDKVFTVLKVSQIKPNESFDYELIEEFVLPYCFGKMASHKAWLLRFSILSIPDASFLSLSFTSRERHMYIVKF